MTNYSLIDKTINIVLTYQEAAYGFGGSFACLNVRKYVEDWYDNTDFTDAQLLAACVLKYNWFTPISYTNALKLKDDYFGSQEEGYARPR